MGTADTPGFAQDIELSGSYAYVADSFAGLQVIDISNPVSPVIVGAVDTPGDGRAVAVSQGFVYIADGDFYVQVIDVKNPLSPILVGGVDTPGSARDVAVSGEYVYVADAGAGLTVLPTQCSIPTPVQLSSFQAFSQPGVVVLEWTVSWSSDFAGFHVQRSIQAGTGYRQITSQLIGPPSPYRFVDSDVTPGITYYYRLEALDRSGRRELFGPVSARVDPVGHPFLAQNRPNPFAGTATAIPFFLPQASDVRIRILDLSGRQVRLLLNQRQDRGHREVSWNGVDDAGRTVAPGVYLYEIQTAGLHATRRLVKLR